MSAEIVPFVFTHDDEATPIRALESDGDPWFVGVDVCPALGLSHGGSAMRRLKAQQKGELLEHTPGGPQNMTVISESSLMLLAMRSDKKRARHSVGPQKAIRPMTDDPHWPDWLRDIWGPAPEGPRKRAAEIARYAAARKAAQERLDALASQPAPPAKPVRPPREYTAVDMRQARIELKLEPPDLEATE